MKFFIVNVNNCLASSQYEPFFYEHIHQEKLVMLDEISDTCQLGDTYKQILMHANRKPYDFQKGVVLLLIPRNFADPLRPQDYELYNDINTYMHLVRNLSSNYSVYTFYVDQTGELELNDAVYQQLKAVNHKLRANKPELRSHFLSLPEQLPAQGGDYKAFLRERIAQLCDCTGSFYTHMLDKVADIDGDASVFGNAINHYIGEARAHLSDIRHIYVPICRNDLADEIHTKLKIVYYIKTMMSGRIPLDQMPDFQDYPFEDAPHVKRLIATYRKRLSVWYHEHLPIPTEGHYDVLNFRCNTNVATEYKTKMTDVISKELNSVGVHGKSNVDMVEEVFARLNGLVTNARDSLKASGVRIAQSLLDSKSYVIQETRSFDLDQADPAEEKAEIEALNKLNKHSPSAPPDFAAENRLEQELEQTNHQIAQVLENLKTYHRHLFAFALSFSILVIAGLYLGAQYSILIKEYSAWIYMLYLLVAGAAFSAAWFAVRRRYLNEIAALLTDCKRKVQNFLNAFQIMAEEFEKNIESAGAYNCLKQQLDQKRAARANYQLARKKYAWHKMKVDQILKNLRFFDPFVGDAHPYEENLLTLDSYDHDPEHTEFYLMKIYQG